MPESTIWMLSSLTTMESADPAASQATVSRLLPGKLDYSKLEM